MKEWLGRPFDRRSLRRGENQPLAAEAEMAARHRGPTPKVLMGRDGYVE